jgi:hypothetical protein
MSSSPQVQAGNLGPLAPTSGFVAEAKANCYLTEIEGPWWILHAKIQRPAGHRGSGGLRIRIVGREVHLERPDADACGIVHFRHLLKLPIGNCIIRLDWIEEGASKQKSFTRDVALEEVPGFFRKKFLPIPSVDKRT